MSSSDKDTTPEDISDMAAFGYLAPREAVAQVDRDPSVVAQLQELFGEAGHVFEWHGDQHWAIPGGYKDAYALKLLAILKTRPNLAHRLLKTDNRLVKMITYRALELQRGDAEERS